MVFADFVASDAAVMTDLQASGIDEADAATATVASFQIATKWEQTRKCPFHKTVVAHELGKVLLPVLADRVQVVCLEVTIVTLMKADEDSHHFAQAECSFSTSNVHTVGQ